jgi:hypothetical protein
MEWTSHQKEREEGVAAEDLKAVRRLDEQSQQSLQDPTDAATMRSVVSTFRVRIAKDALTVYLHEPRGHRCPWRFVTKPSAAALAWHEACLALLLRQAPSVREETR